MLSIQNLQAAYGKVQVLHGISLEVPKGKLVTLIGSNGAGKTTTMRAISGMIRPKGGSVTLDGR
ncbi:MAG: transporter ATP-binding protein, partial [Massilia sp.]|nr:transporter ATP-binding protein [Massilia sp.]